MANTEWEVLLSPPSRNGMQITRANTARLNLDIDIVVAEWLRLELVEVKLGPFLRVFNLEAFERVRINHFEFNIPGNCSINSIQFKIGKKFAEKGKDRKERRSLRKWRRNMLARSRSRVAGIRNPHLQLPHSHGGVEIPSVDCREISGILFYPY